MYDPPATPAVCELHKVLVAAWAPAVPNASAVAIAAGTASVAVAADTSFLVHLTVNLLWCGRRQRKFT